MKNKKLTYILLPVVLAIWAIIFYRIFSASAEKDDARFNDAGASTKEEYTPADTFSLAGDYRDPFLGTPTQVNNTPRQNITINDASPKKEEVKAAAKAWPAVSYAGMIKNQASSAQLAMVKLNGKSYTMKPGESMQEVQLLKIFRDSIEVKFQGEKRIVKK